MRNRILEYDPLLSQLKKLLAETFRFSEVELNQATDDEPLIGGSLRLDYLDTLELGMYVEEEFDIPSGSVARSRTALATLADLADFIRCHAPQRMVVRRTQPPLPRRRAFPSSPSTVLSSSLEYSASAHGDR